jgi:hypothetical protein
MTIPVTTPLTSHRDSRRLVRAWVTEASKKLSGWMASGYAGLRELAPYAVIELVLPGGSLMALALWWYRRHRRTQVCVAPNQCNRIRWMPQS